MTLGLVKNLLTRENYDLIKRFFAFLKPYRKWMVWATACMIISVVLVLPVPLVTRHLIDVTFKGTDFRFLHWVCFGLAIVIIINNFLHYVQNKIYLMLRVRLLFDTKLKLFKHITGMQMKYFENLGTGYLMSRIVDDIRASSALFAETFVNFIRNMGTLVVAGAFIFFIHWKLALISLIFFPCYFFSILLFGGKINYYASQFLEKTALTNQYLQESISGVYFVKTFTAEKREARNLVRKMKDAVYWGVRSEMTRQRSGLATGLVAGMGPLIILWYGGYEVMQDNLTVGDFVAFNMLIGILYPSATFFAHMGFAISESLAAIKRIFKIFEIPVEYRRHIRLDKSKTIPDLQGRIVFDHVNFSYTGNEPTLTDIQFQVEPGEIVAFIGPCGAGKTTIVNLLCRFYGPIEGKVTLDGRDVEDLDLKWLREQISWVAQETFLFNATIEDNIRYGNLKVSREEIEEITQKIHVHDMIMSFPKNYQTVVGERGAKLSSGQKQLISIARAILKKPQILILDEATASLDSETERLVQEAYRSVAKGRTTLIISHRLSTIRWAQKIVILEKGKIANIGSHEQLVNASLFYRHLCQSQKSA